MYDITLLWLVFSWPIILVVIPLVYFTKRRVNWRWWEGAALIVPFAIWLSLETVVDRPKSLANLFEYAAMVVAIPIAASVRILVAQRLPQLPVAAALQLALVVVIILVYFKTPLLPE